jgi:hypothetical protein
VPACIVTQVGDVISVKGDNLANSVRITDSGTGAVGAVKVQADATFFASTGLVRTIRVDALAGNDTVTYNLVGNLLAGQTRLVSVVLGDGNDGFGGSLINPASGLGSDLSSNSALQINVFGGKGNDFMNMDATHGADVRQGARFGVQLLGEDGTDTILAHYRGDLDGQLAWVSDGGLGMDCLIRTEAIAEVGSTGKAFLRVLGGDGNDFGLGLLVSRPSTCALDATLDGGAGFDVGAVGGDPAIVMVNVP